MLKLLPNVPSVQEEVTLAEDAITGEPENSTTGSNHQTGDVNEINKLADESSESQYISITSAHPLPPAPPCPTLPHPATSYPTLPRPTLPHPTQTYPQTPPHPGGKFSDKRDIKIHKVRVDNFGRKENEEDCKTFLKEFNDVISVERVDGRDHSHGSYDVTFEDEKCARKFFKMKKIEYKERTLRRRLLYSCSLCPKSYYSLMCLYPHMTKDHGGDPFECSDCGKVFKKKEMHGGT